METPRSGTPPDPIKPHGGGWTCREVCVTLDPFVYRAIRDSNCQLTRTRSLTSALLLYTPDLMLHILERKRLFKSRPHEEAVIALGRHAEGHTVRGPGVDRSRRVGRFEGFPRWAHLNGHVAHGRAKRSVGCGSVGCGRVGCGSGGSIGPFEQRRPRGCESGGSIRPFEQRRPRGRARGPWDWPARSEMRAREHGRDVPCPEPNHQRDAARQLRGGAQRRRAPASRCLPWGGRWRAGAYPVQPVAGEEKHSPLVRMRHVSTRRGAHVAISLLKHHCRACDRCT